MQTFARWCNTITTRVNKRVCFISCHLNGISSHNEILHQILFHGVRCYVCCSTAWVNQKCYFWHDSFGHDSVASRRNVATNQSISNSICGSLWTALEKVNRNIRNGHLARNFDPLNCIAVSKWCRLSAKIHWRVKIRLHWEVEASKFERKNGTLSIE